MLMITEKLTKDILTIDDTNLIYLTYNSLNELSPLINKMVIDDYFILLEILDSLVIKTRLFSLDVLCSFVKRLAIFICKLPEKVCASYLLFIKHIFLKYPNINSLIDEEDFDPFDNKMNDPTLANGKQSNINKELKQIDVLFKKHQIIPRIIEYIIKLDKKFPSLASLNYFDLLLNK